MRIIACSASLLRALKLDFAIKIIKVGLTVLQKYAIYSK